MHFWGRAKDTVYCRIIPWGPASFVCGFFPCLTGGGGWVDGSEKEGCLTQQPCFSRAVFSRFARPLQHTRSIIIVIWNRCLERARARGGGDGTVGGVTGPADLPAYQNVGRQGGQLRLLFPFPLSFHCRFGRLGHYLHHAVVVTTFYICLDFRGGGGWLSRVALRCEDGGWG